MSIMPEGEDLRKAVKWISGERQMRPGISLPKLLNDACKRFDLSPCDSDFLFRYITEEQKKEGG